MKKTEKQNRFINKWKNKRGNKYIFALIYGSLIWGMLTLFFIILTDYFLNETFFLFKKIVIGIPVFFIGGFFYGLWIFNINESKYQKFIKETNNEEKEE